MGAASSLELADRRARAIDARAAVSDEASFSRYLDTFKPAKGA